MSDTASKLHGWRHDDYEVAKEHIWQQLGSLDGLEVFGRQVLVGVYTRPAFNTRSGLMFTEKEQRNDWYEGKVVLVLAHGPDAFKGTENWLKSTYPGDAPKIGDWLFQNANTGIQFSFRGDGAQRVTYEDRRGEQQPVYPGDGWPVRIVNDDGFLGRLREPHSVV